MDADPHGGEASEPMPPVHWRLHRFPYFGSVKGLTRIPSAPGRGGVAPTRRYPRWLAIFGRDHPTADGNTISAGRARPHLHVQQIAGEYPAPGGVLVTCR